MDFFRGLKYAVTNESQAAVRVKVLTSDEGPDPTEMQMEEIARATYSFEHFTEIMRTIWGRLNADGREYKKIEKALLLLHYILIHGSDQVATESKVHVMEVKTLTDFRYTVGPAEVGAKIRERSHSIMKFLNDETKLVEARAEAKARRGGN